MFGTLFYKGGVCDLGKIQGIAAGGGYVTQPLRISNVL